jgi:integrase
LLKLRWCNVDFDLNAINFTETKTNRDRSVPMEPIVQEALVNLPDEAGDAEYVFTNPDTGTGIPTSRSPSQQHAEKRLSLISPFMTCVTRLVHGWTMPVSTL